MRHPNTWSDTQRRLLLTGYPFTIVLMILKVVSLFFATVPALGWGGFLGHLIFQAPQDITAPWTLLTYSAVVEPVMEGRGFLNFLFELGLTYWFCSSLERSWGTKNFAWFFAAVTAATAISLAFGAWIIHGQFLAIHLLPVAACALAWGLVNAEEQVSLFFIPMRGIHMALIAIGFVMFQFAGQQPITALSGNGTLGQVAYQTSGWWAVPFALVGCGVAWLWVRNGWQYGFGTLLPNVSRHTIKRPGLRQVPLPSKNPKPKDDRFTMRDLNPLEWIAKRRRRKQFEKLMRDD